MIQHINFPGVRDLLLPVYIKQIYQLAIYLDNTVIKHSLTFMESKSYWYSICVQSEFK